MASGWRSGAFDLRALGTGGLARTALKRGVGAFDGRWRARRAHPHTALHRFRRAGRTCTGIGRHPLRPVEILARPVHERLHARRRRWSRVAVASAAMGSPMRTQIRVCARCAIEVLHEPFLAPLGAGRIRQPHRLAPRRDRATMRTRPETAAVPGNVVPSGGTPRSSRPP